mmetsp:Transcript_35478/g.98028  ORF Transcript_35478/g.98028 Transcript_35478/m.98028 type:complete len:837 (-) Transcript_35478:101-2611(-)
MAQQSSFVGASGDDQDRLLEEASSVVKEQAYFMKKAIDNDSLREALKHASNLICELRTSLLSPKNYYELYMQVFQEMQHLSNFFGDKSRHNRKMLELYESVQHAGSILPRMYLLATVGASYIKSKEAPAKEILQDMNELTKGVQHPMRGLFLRYYLSQMVKDKLPDTGTEYEGEGGDINDAFEFIFTNFCESNRLWVRMQQGLAKDKQKREKERHDLRVLVGSNLVRMSALDGMTAEYYTKNALPKLLDHVISVKDPMSQQYLLESMIQVFPDEFHIKSLEQVLEAYTKAMPTVDMKMIMVTLMNRLATFLMNAEGAPVMADVDVFSLIRTHLKQILERAMHVNHVQGRPTPPPDITAPLEVQAAFMQFTISLYPEKIHYVDIIMGSTADILNKYTLSFGSRTKLGGPGAEKVKDLLACPLKSMGLNVLEMDNYATLVSFLNFATRKEVAKEMCKIVVDEDKPLKSVQAVERLFQFIKPLLEDEEDTPSDESADKETFAADQHHVCRLVHQIRPSEDSEPDGVDTIDAEFAMLSAMRNFFGSGGPNRMCYTLPTVCYAGLGLIPKIRERERWRAQRAAEGVDVRMPQLTLKKVFQFIHKTNTPLVQVAPDEALRLWLVAAAAADGADRVSPGSFEAICNEFMTQAMICFEEELSDTARQFQGIFLMVGTMSSITCLEAEHHDAISSKIAQYSARLLKKPLQCRAVATCSHLFWSDARRDGKRVLECLQKCLKIISGCFMSDMKQVALWVEMLDKYVFYFDQGVEEVNLSFVQDLLKLCRENVEYAEKDSSAQAEAKRARDHLRNAVEYLRLQKNSADQQVANKYAELSLDDVANLL